MPEPARSPDLDRAARTWRGYVDRDGHLLTKGIAFRDDDEARVCGYEPVTVAALPHLPSGDSTPASPEQRVVYDCAHNNARYANPCDRCPASLTERAERVVAECLVDQVMGGLRAPVVQKVVVALRDAGLLAPAPTSEEESK